MKLLPNGLSIDFVGKRNHFAVVSAILVMLSLVLFLTIGPNYGIDFTGGTEIHFRFKEPLDIGEVRQAIEKVGISADSVQRVGTRDRGEFVVRVQDATFGSDTAREEVETRLKARFGDGWIQEIRFSAEVGARMTVVHGGDSVPMPKIVDALEGMKGVQIEDSSDDNAFYVKLPGLSSQIEAAISQALGGREFEVLSIDSVGPKVGGELRKQGLIAIGTSLVIMLIYIAFRFDMSFAPGAIIALFHDVTLVVGVFVILRRQVDMSIIGVLLTIVGYSINDTIVIYDRVRENLKKYRRKDLPRLINDTINEMLGRTIATSLTTFLAIIPFLFLGGAVIQNFALAMLMGIVFGTYSTIYVASPIMITLQGLKPRLGSVMALGQRGTAADAAGANKAQARPDPEELLKRMSTEENRRG